MRDDAKGLEGDLGGTYTIPHCEDIGTQVCTHTGTYTFLKARDIYEI